MAHGLIRWPAVVGAACLAVMVALYHDAPQYAIGFQGTAEGRRAVVFDSLRRLDQSIDSVRLRGGEIRGLMSVGRRAPGFSVVTRPDSSVTRAVSDSIGRIFDSAWARQPSRDTSIKVLIRVGDGWPSMRMLHPIALDGATCVRGGWWYGAITAPDVEHSLGSCGYYAAFGRPGPAIERWFTTSAIGFQADPPAWRPVPDTTNWYQRQKAAWADGGWTLRLARAGVPAPYEFSAKLAGCAGGSQGACADATLSPIPPPRPGESYYFTPMAGIGPLTTVLLPDLIHEFGPDRFRAFWKSPDAVSVAFERAFGVSLDNWVRGEVIAYYGPLQLGAGDVGRAGISAFIWALIFLGLTALIARRLQY
ncbi:MAG TPA: hypothetical protein VFI39_09785 [Gemmatimonadales bacterium]|nr:hypothetical protein [Gemmatimonadales bacterium]